MPSNLEAVQLYRIESPAASHLHYQIHWQGHELDNHFLRLNLDQNGMVFSASWRFPASNPVGLSTALGRPYLGDGKFLVRSRPVLHFTGSEWLSGWKVAYRNSSDDVFESFLDQRGIEYHIESLLDRIKDTTVRANVYLPDPISTSGADYGFPYSDNNDQASPELQAEMVEVDVPMLYKNDSFQLWNEYARSVDWSSPNFTPYRSTSDFFLFNRDDKPFEEVNALYHFTEFIKQTKDYGFNLPEKTIFFDAHAFDGDDYSAFNRLDTAIGFGTGGVDDGEDADIVIHELGHALSFYAAPETNGGFERRGFDEAICDYFACSWSYKWETNGYKKIFNWDGHNEFWPGRNLDNQERYPEDLGGDDFYQSSLIYSGMLSDLMDDIGRDALDPIVLQSLYSSFLGMEFPQAAVELVMADSMLNDAIHKKDICFRLLERGILDCDTVFRPNNIAAEELIQLDGIVATDLRWFTATENVWDVYLYDVSGRLIFQEADMDPYSLQLKFNGLSPGLYLLHLAGDIDKKLRVLVVPDKP